jgi:myo-inositol 2-dehydrogenase/D-chiro-inositol 1-dehydrogenase
MNKQKRGKYELCSQKGRQIMSNRLRVALIGAGRIGHVHAEAIATLGKQAQLVMVADIFASSRNALGQKYGIPATDNYHDILNNPAIDAVLICSSTDTHIQIITDAARAGKHIFCEKPIDHNLERIDRALATVKEAGVKLMIGFNRRFDANFAKIQQMIVAGKIGVPHILRITSRDPAPPPVEYIKVSGGIFLDMTIHDFDMARFLFGEVEEVFVAGGVMVDPAIGEADDIDTAIVTLKFANGAIGTIDNSRQAVYGYDQRVEAFGSAGMVNAANNYPNTHTYYHAGGVESEKPLYFFLERYMASYANEMKAFVECVLNDTDPLVTGEDGRAPVVMAMAAWKSYRENRPVKISEIGILV